MTRQQLNACGPGDVLPKFKADAGMVRGPAVESLASLSSPLLFTCKCFRSLLFLSSLLFSFPARSSARRTRSRRLARFLTFSGNIAISRLCSFAVRLVGVAHESVAPGTNQTDKQPQHQPPTSADYYRFCPKSASESFNLSVSVIQLIHSWVQTIVCRWPIS